MKSCRIACLLCCVALAPAALASPRQGTLPYGLSIRVDYVGENGSAELAAMIGVLLRDEIDSRGCVTSARLLDLDEAPATPLLLRVRLSELEERTRHLVSIAEQARSPDPRARQAYMATFEANVQVELIALPSQLVVREARFHQASTRSPRTLIEDANLAAREEAVEELVRTARKKVCGGSLKKLGRRIEAALAQPAAQDGSR